MAYITLSEAKKHLNIEEAFTADDTLITMQIEVAICAVENHLNFSFADRYGEGSLPAPIKAAALLLVGDLYKTREASVDKQLTTPTYSYLLSPYKLYKVS